MDTGPIKIKRYAAKIYLKCDIRKPAINNHPKYDDSELSTGAGEYCSFSRNNASRKIG